MSSLLPPTAAAGGWSSPAPERFDLSVGEARCPAVYRAPAVPPHGPAVGVLLLADASLEGVEGRLARTLARVGHAVLRIAIDQLPSAEERRAVALAGLDALRARATQRRTVVVGSVAGAALVAGIAAEWRADGLVVIGTRLPPAARPADLEIFDALEPFVGLLLVLGAGATEENDPEAQALLERAGSWRDARSGRHLEMGVVDGPRSTLPVDADHTLSLAAFAGVVEDFTRQWLERRFGPGYPRAWQGPPPAFQIAPHVRTDGIEACVPLLATGAKIVEVTDGAIAADKSAWRLELPDGREFALTAALRSLVSLIDGHRTLAEITERLSAEMGRPLKLEQVDHLVRERLAPLEVLVPDSRGEGGEEESGMTDILIRVYEPHDRLRALLDNITRVTRSPYNVVMAVGKRSAVRNQNVALDRTLTKYAVFLDDDVILTEGWLERLREAMDRTGAGAVSARQLRMSGVPLSTALAASDGSVVEALSGGACFMFRTDLGLRFDDHYVRSQWDDVDFMFQLYERGYGAYVDGRVDFYHHNDPKVWRAQNLTYFVNKWIGKGLLRGWALYVYDAGGSAFMPCFGPENEARMEAED